MEYPRLNERGFGTYLLEPTVEVQRPKENRAAVARRKMRANTAARTAVAIALVDGPSPVADLAAIGLLTGYALFEIGMALRMG